MMRTESENFRGMDRDETLLAFVMGSSPALNQVRASWHLQSLSLPPTLLFKQKIETLIREYQAQSPALRDRGVPSEWKALGPMGRVILLMSWMEEGRLAQVAEQLGIQTDLAVQELRRSYCILSSHSEAGLFPALKAGCIGPENWTIEYLEGAVRNSGGTDKSFQWQAHLIQCPTCRDQLDLYRTIRNHFKARAWSLRRMMSPSMPASC